MVKKYRKKPVEIEAIKWTDDNFDEITNFVENNISGEMWQGNNCYGFFINTLEGNMRASKDDYIIKGVNGEFYPCKPDIFEKTYEKVK